MTVTSTRSAAERIIDTVHVDGAPYWRLRGPNRPTAIAPRTGPTPPFVLTEGLEFDRCDDGTWVHTPVELPSALFWWAVTITLALSVAGLRWPALFIPAVVVLAAAVVREANRS